MEKVSISICIDEKEIEALSEEYVRNVCAYVFQGNVKIEQGNGMVGLIPPNEGLMRSIEENLGLTAQEQRDCYRSSLTKMVGHKKAHPDVPVPAIDVVLRKALLRKLALDKVNTVLSN